MSSSRKKDPENTEYMSGFARIIKQAMEAEAERRKRIDSRLVSLTEEDKTEIKRYFVTNLKIDLLFLIVFLVAAPLLFHASNLMYGNPLVNYLVHSNIELQIIFCVSLTLLVVSASVFIVLKYRKKIYWKNLPKGVSRGLNRVFTLGLTSLNISVFYFFFHFFPFLNEYNLYVNYSLFCGLNYYITGYFGYVLNYSMIFEMLQVVINHWEVMLYYLDTPLFMVSILIILGGLLYVKQIVLRRGFTVI
ncbi:MAG: hypothetical protein ACETWM_01000 [Candidatus Lokiarchaeia archaeon]